MATIRGGILIDAPVDVVFDLVADERNEPAYNPELISAELLGPEPVGAGSRFRAVHSSKRGPMEMTVELTAYDRPRRLASVTHASWAEIDGAVTFEPAGAGNDSTYMHWEWRVRPKGVAWLMTPFIGTVGRREEQACWEGLKRYVESGRLASGAGGHARECVERRT